MRKLAKGAFEDVSGDRGLIRLEMQMRLEESLRSRSLRQPKRREERKVETRTLGRESGTVAASVRIAIEQPAACDPAAGIRISNRDELLEFL